MDFDLDEDNLRQFLIAHKFPRGLQEALVKGCHRFPVRYFIIDDSGSMARNDGRHRIGEGPQSKMVKCTRWSELTSAIRFHAALAEAAKIPTEFRLLNGAPPITVGRKGDDGTGYRTIIQHLDNSPGGGTPLCRHIEEVTTHLRSIESVLRANGQRAVIIIMTDGEASDGNISQVMRPLHDLPVWLVVRLCTDEEPISSYWNKIDKELELEMDVLDDLYGEAQEIGKLNGWITYGEPLHRLREWGVQVKEIDLIDEASLSAEQMRSVCTVLFCPDKKDTLPHPDVNWGDFYKAIELYNSKEENTWDCVKQKVVPWIKLDKLRSQYHGGKCTIM